ncbi:hypothetical protein COOONC_04703, partial [Cooperia oncophora]
LFRLVKFHEVAIDFELCNIYAGRLNIPDLLEFEECFLRAAFDYARPMKQSKMGDVIERSLTERIFGVYATYVLYYAQPSDYVSKILATPRDLIELKQFVTDVLLPGRHLDTIGCIYKLLADDAFSVGAFTKCYDPVCHRGYTLPFSSDDVVDDDERHTPLEAANYVMDHPVLKTMVHVQKEMQLKQNQISTRPVVAEVEDNFLDRINKYFHYAENSRALFQLSFFRLYTTLKREINKVGVVCDPEEPDPNASADENGVNETSTNEEPTEGPSRSSIKDKAYASTIQYARNRRYADPKMFENFPDAANDGEGAVEGQTASSDQPTTDVASPPKKKKKPKPKPQTTEPPSAGDGAGDVFAPNPATQEEDVPSSKRRQKMKAPKRSKVAPKAQLEAEPKKETKPKVVEQIAQETVR